MKKQFKNWMFLALTVVLLGGCGKMEENDTFGKKEMFTNYADNLILPAYTNYGNKLKPTSQTALNDFKTTSNLTTLTALQSAFLSDL
jgi:hypothetical protein